MTFKTAWNYVFERFEQFSIDFSSFKKKILCILGSWQTTKHALYALYV